MNPTRTALILGATGGIGGAVALRLLAAGWHVTALHRDADAQRARTPAFNWVQGDAMVRADVLNAAQGADLIVHAVNPPGYRNWAALVLPMMDNSIAAARASGARIVLPGTVYNYGADAFPFIDEDAVQHPATRKGAIRVQLEQRLEQAARDGVRSLIVRAGDYFGPGAANTWFAQLATPGKPVVTVRNPGTPGTGHQWAYLPDVAETMVRLVEREAALPVFARFHMDGHWDSDGLTMTATVARVAGARSVKPLAWWLLMALSPFVTTLRELREMRYLWKTPVRLDNQRLRDFLGNEPHTPLDEAVHTTLAGLGCVPHDATIRSGTTGRSDPACAAG